MDRSRIGGVLICLGTVTLAGLFIWGIVIGSYWAVAVPVIVLFLGILALAFWIGWTIATTATEVPKPEVTKETGEASQSK